MKASFEKIAPIFGSSYLIAQYISPNPDIKSPFWHFHPELEIVYVKGGNGKRNVGNHLSNFYNGELVFLGENLPHCAFVDPTMEHESETIIQMRSDFLGETFFEIPEMTAIHQMFERAKFGLCFYGDSKYRIGARIEQLPRKDKFEQLLELLSILQEMAQSDEYHILNANGITLEVSHQDNNRITLIYNFVQHNFHRPIKLKEVAEKANMTIPAFCRYFKRLSNKTFTYFVNEFRVIHACKLLSEQNLSITDICFQSGFNNFSHFSRIFKDITGKSPSAYRRDLVMLVN